MNTIRANGAEYLLTVKKGNPLTYQEMQEMFTDLKAENEQLSDHADKAVIYEKQMETYKTVYSDITLDDMRKMSENFNETVIGQPQVIKRLLAPMYALRCR